MDGRCLGVFGAELKTKEEFESSVAKKSEAEGIKVFHRTEGGVRLSFLDALDFPEKIQGYSAIASLSDYALYFFPSTGRLSAADGELAVLISTYGIPGSIVVHPGLSPDEATRALKGTALGEYPVTVRSQGSSVFEPPLSGPRPDFPSKGTILYIDRVFTVKGVGTVALGFVLSGSVKVHDKLRPIPGAQGKWAEVKGIQVNDVDVELAGRGIRVGLSLRGVEPEDLERSHWLDDGSFSLGESLSLDVAQSGFYKGEVADRDLHLQLPGELVPAHFEKEGGSVVATLPWPVPRWEGMRTCIVDLNGKGLRIAAGATCKF